MEKRTVFEDFADFSLALEQDLVADGNYHFSGFTISVKGEMVYFDCQDPETLLELALLVADTGSMTIH